jgi:hypothetical protein
MTLENRATLSMQHYAAVTTAICNILCSRSSATMALMFIPVHHNREGQPEELRKPHFMRLLRPEPCLDSSSPTYGSNTAHCLTARNQLFLLATQRITACWGIH